MEKVRITFASGNSIEAEKNGDSYIIEEPFGPGIENELSEVTIEGEDGIRELHDTELIECYSIDGRYWFAFREIPKRESEEVQLRADVDYLLAITE